MLYGDYFMRRSVDCTLQKKFNIEVGNIDVQSLKSQSLTYEQVKCIVINEITNIICDYLLFSSNNLSRNQIHEHLRKTVTSCVVEFDESDAMKKTMTNFSEKVLITHFMSLLLVKLSDKCQQYIQMLF